MLIPILLAAQSLIAPPEREYNAAWLDGIVPSGLVSLFTAKEFHHGEKTFYYRLFEPVVKPGQKYPILLWASGYGEFGDNNFAQLRHLHYIFHDAESREKKPFYCLVMQVPRDHGCWFLHPG